jgi:threonine dehydrogenase-like Zn-dependent dehydrogenase
VVIDCTGSAAGFELALQIVRPRGVVVLKSTVAGKNALNLAPVVIDEVTIIGSRCGPFKEAIRALAQKQIDVVSLIHRRMKLEQGVEAMQLAGRAGVLKVILSMD